MNNISSGQSKEKKYFIATYGCQMNVSDSEVLAGYLERMGFSAAKNEEDADIVIINTCAVREKAEEKVFSRLGMLRELKQKKPDIILALWGCLAQYEGIAQKVKERFKFIDLVSGPNALDRFPELLKEATSSDKTVTDLDLSGEREFLPAKRNDDFKAWVPISHGCNNYCSYCVVPYVRGPEISRLPENIINEIKKLISNGYKEITVLGQNVNSYGKDLQQNIDFADLMLKLDQLGDSIRLRFMTSHPRDFSEKIIRAIAEGKNICEHIHLPLQSGSDRILKKMNRGYNRDYYLEQIEKIRKIIPGSSITTDIIVGFPGENEEDFAQTVEMLERVRFDAAYIFVYSPRRGTKAAGMENQVFKEVKRKRIIQLNRQQKRITLEKNQPLLGSIQEVLVEGKSKKNAEMFTGRTRTNKIVHFSCTEDLSGKFINIKIIETRAWNLIGIIDQR